MQDFLRNLIHRFQLEQGHMLVADADESAVDLPDEDQWQARLEQAADEAEQVDTVEALMDAVDRHRRQMPLVGGPFDQLTIPDGEGGNNTLPPVPVPPLMRFKHLAQRILFKEGLFSHQAILILTDAAALAELSQTALVEAGRELRAYFEDAYEEPRKARRKLPVVMNVLMLGTGVATPQTRSRLRQLHKGFSPRDRVFVRGYALDPVRRSVVSSTRWPLEPMRTLLKRGLRRPSETAEQMRRRLETARLRPTVIAAGVFTAVGLNVLGIWLIFRFDLFDVAILFWLKDFVSPVLGVSLGIALNELKRHCARQAQYTAGIYLALWGAAMLYLLWPPSLNLVLYLAGVGLMAFWLAMLAGTVAEVDG